MSQYLLRLDDACEKRDITAWDRMEALLDRYDIKPLVGIIPCCHDPMMDSYPVDAEFWERVDRWSKKGWILALHGCDHVYRTEDGGLNPVNRRSEFAGEPLSVQREKIRRGVAVMESHGHSPRIFFAPSHTFDNNTLEALRLESRIRVISDTIASDIYRHEDFCYIPLQSGHFCTLPVKLMSACLHPNAMTEDAFQALEAFLSMHHAQFINCAARLEAVSFRPLNCYDRFLRRAYFTVRKMRQSRLE